MNDVIISQLTNQENRYKYQQHACYSRNGSYIKFIYRLKLIKTDKM